MTEVEVLKTDDDYLVYPFENNQGNNYCFKWRDTKEEMLNVIDNLIDDVNFNYYKKGFITDIKSYMRDYIDLYLKLHNNYDDNVGLGAWFGMVDLFERHSVFIQRFLCGDNELRYTNVKGMMMKLLYPLQSYKYQDDIDDFIMEIINEKIYEEIDDYYGYDKDEIPKGEIN